MMQIDARQSSKLADTCILGRNRERESNIELFRIILMLSIVAHHYVVNSGVFSLCDNGLRGLVLLCFGAWGKIAINCFILITGWFMCDREITVGKFFRLFGQIVFWNVACGLAFLTFGRMSFSFDWLMKSVFPFSGMNSSFAGAFLAFFLLIPFLNVLIRNITKRQYQFLLVVLLVTFSGFAFLRDYRIVINYVEWFCIVYLVGAYLRLYPHRLIDRPRMTFCLAAVLILGVLTSVVAMSRLVPGGYAYYFTVDSNKPSALVAAIFLFLCFKNLRIRYSRVINLLASTTFGVFLIHANSDVMRNWLWEDVCRCVDWYDTAYCVPHAFVCVVMVFLVCSFLETGRRCIVKSFRLDEILRHRAGKAYKEIRK